MMIRWWQHRRYWKRSRKYWAQFQDSGKTVADQLEFAKANLTQGGQVGLWQ